MESRRYRSYIGGLSGAFSYGFGKAASAIGSKLGFAISKTTHIGSGINFGRVFNASKLMTIGAGIGKGLGIVSGSVLGDYLGNSIFGHSYLLKDKLTDLIVDEIPDLIFEFIEWALRN